MNLSPRLLGITAVSVLTPALEAAIVFTASETLSLDNQIDDPPFAGVGRQLTISTSATQMTDLSITLDLSSAAGDTAWNGDLYAQISGPSGTLAVLLNRTGLSPSDDAGYGDSGFSLTINDSGANPDLHTYQGVSYTLNGSGQLTGTWASDGRQDALSSVRDRPLSQFLGQDPNGTWTLLVADLANGNRAQLNSWSISGVGVAVPEPKIWTAIAGAGLLGFALLRRSRRSH